MAEPPLSKGQLQSLCQALGDTLTGLTGTEISKILAGCGIDDPGPMTKRDRLLQALGSRQLQDRSSNNVLAFVEASLDPARYVHDPNRYSVLRQSTNRALSFAGYFVNDEGKVRRMAPAKTLDEAVQAANRVMSELQRREVHPDVIRYCRTELLQEDYFHAIHEATKGLAETLRSKVGSHEDGWKLVEYALSGDKNRLPRLAFNTLQTETEWSEHQGLASLIKGVLALYRNPTAHIPRLKRRTDEQESLDALTLISMLYRRLDQAVPTIPERPLTRD